MRYILEKSFNLRQNTSCRKYRTFFFVFVFLVEVAKQRTGNFTRNNKNRTILPKDVKKCNTVVKLIR